MQKIISPISLVITSALLSAVAHANDENSPPVSRYWQQYIDSRQVDSDLYNTASDIKGDAVLTNFSYAGYQRGEAPLPQGAIAPNGARYKTFKVTDFGAITNDNISDKKAIVAAIKAAETYVQQSEKHAAEVVFPSGQLLINEASDIAEQGLINISESNIVLRGQGADKTELFMRYPLQPKDPQKMWSTPRIINFTAPNKGLPSEPVVARVTSSMVAGSAKKLAVKAESEAQLQVGDWVTLSAHIKRGDYIESQIAPYKLEKRWTKLKKSLNLQEIHQVKSISADHVEFYTPIQVDIDLKDQWQLSKVAMLEQVGLENLRIRGHWQVPFKHHKRTQDGLVHDSAWSLVQMRRVANSWAQNLEFVDFNAGLALSMAANTTVKDLTLNGNAGHLSLQMQYSFNNLSMNVVDNSNAWHAPGFSHAASSNVHLNTRFNANTSSDLHGAQPRINLFDNVEGGWIYGRWGAAVANQPNHLKGLVYWNYHNIDAPIDDYEFMRENNAYGRIVMPYLIGFHGAGINVRDTRDYMEYVNEAELAHYPEPLKVVPQAYIESMGKPVYPQSLYRAQVEQRLGYLPEWLK